MFTPDRSFLTLPSCATENRCARQRAWTGGRILLASRWWTSEKWQKLAKLICSVEGVRALGVQSTSVMLCFSGVQYEWRLAVEISQFFHTLFWVYFDSKVKCCGGCRFLPKGWSCMHSFMKGFDCSSQLPKLREAFSCLFLKWWKTEKMLKSEACRMADREAKRVTTKLLFSLFELLLAWLMQGSSLFLSEIKDM